MGVGICWEAAWRGAEQGLRIGPDIQSPGVMIMGGSGSGMLMVAALIVLYAFTDSFPLLPFLCSRQCKEPCPIDDLQTRCGTSG